ncbi:MAG: hypothetical protein ACD_29C00073G0001 [uncultured bacterium]|nr:MAG: hypothetical protein ACD_29C00073G0001 [uncultured bacterium]
MQPGTKPLSTKICAPLQIPKINFPVCASCNNAFMIASCAAMTPERLRSSNENPPTMTKASHCFNFLISSNQKISMGVKFALSSAIFVSRSQLDPGN